MHLFFLDDGAIYDKKLSYVENAIIHFYLDSWLNTYTKWTTLVENANFHTS